MSIKINRLLDEPHYSFADFSSNFSKARKIPNYIMTNYTDDQLVSSLSNVLSGIYNHKTKPMLRNKNEEESILNKKQLFELILDKITGIESTLLFWMVPKTNSRIKFTSLSAFMDYPLDKKINMTQGSVTSEYLANRDLEQLLQSYKRFIDRDKIENPGRYGKTIKIKPVNKRPLP